MSLILKLESKKGLGVRFQEFETEEELNTFANYIKLGKRYWDFSIYNLDEEWTERINYIEDKFEKPW